MAGRFSIDAVFRAVDRMTVPVRKMQASVQRFAKATSAGLTEVDKLTTHVHDGLKRVAGVAVGAGAAFGVVAHNVISTGAAFDQQMANVAAVSLMTRDQVADLETKARQLGSTTKFTAVQVAEAMELMGKAGFTNAQVLASIEGVLNAAAAEGADVAEVAGHVSNVLKGMGLEAAEAGRVADVLALASARTNSSITSLGESMSNVSSTARQFNIPLEQVVGSVALLQDVGLDASVAGSALNTMLTQLAAPSAKAKAAMQKLGVQFEDAHGNMLPLTDVFAQLLKAMDGSKGNMGAVAFFAELVGLRGQKAAQNLADLFRQVDPVTKKTRVASLFDELEAARGSAKKMADLRMDTFQGDITRLGAAVDAFKIELFDTQRGPLRDVVQGMTAWVGQNKELVKTNIARYLRDIVHDLPQIIRSGQRILKVVIAFYALATAVRVAKGAVEAYVLSTKAFGAVTAGIRAMTVAMGIYNAEVAAAEGGLTGMRAGLNASTWGEAINSVTSKLGKAGLLGAALAVGVVFGKWLNDTFELDKKLADLIGRITGLNDELEKSRNPQRDAVKERKRMAAELEASLKDKTPSLAEKAALANLQAPNLGPAALQDAVDRVVNAVTPLDPGLARLDPRAEFVTDETRPGYRSQMISPQERTARSIEESNTTTTQEAEVTIRDETGRASVTKKPKALRLKLQPTGGL